MTYISAQLVAYETLVRIIPGLGHSPSGRLSPLLKCEKKLADLISNLNPVFNPNLYRKPV